MRLSKVCCALVTMISSAVVPVNATTFVVNETIDLELIDLSRPFNWQQPLTVDVFPVFDGDRIDVSVNFARGQSLRIDQDGMFGMTLSLTLGGGTEVTPSNVSFEFFDLVTNGPFQNGIDTGRQLAGHGEGRLFHTSDLGIEAPGSFIQFSGMRMAFDIALLDDAPNNGFGRLDMLGRNATPVQISTVPVPAAVWLFASALFGLIGISRRKIAALGAEGCLSAR